MTSEAGYPSAAYAYFIVGVMMVAYMFAFVDRMALSLVVDPIRRDLHLTETQVSALAGASFVICYVLFSFPFGRWVDRRSRRDVMTLGVALWSVAMIGSGLATRFWPLFAGRMLVGAGEASVNPAAYSMIPDCFPPERRTFGMAIFSSGAAVGGGLGVYLGSLLLNWAEAMHPVFPFLGRVAPWKLLFIGMGLPGVAVSILIFLTVREPARRNVGVIGDHAPSAEGAAAYLRRHARLFTLVFVGFSGFAISNYGFTVWGPSYFMRVHHLTVAQVGLLAGLGFAVFGTAGMLTGGLWSDRLIKAGRPEAPIGVALRAAWIQAPLFLGAYLSPWTTPATVLFCAGMFAASLVGGLQGAMIQALAPNRLRGQVGAVFLTTVNLLGLGIAPTLTALMTDYVFGGPAGVGKSLAVTSAVSLAMASILIALAMRSARARAHDVLNS